MARRYTWLIIVGLMLLGIVVVTCVLRMGRVALSPGQESPQAVLRKAQRALIAGDKTGFLECLAVRSDHYKAAAEALFDCALAARTLRLTLREHYGKNAWETFVSLQADPAQFSAFDWLGVDDFVSTAAIEAKDDEARVELPAPHEALGLRREGVWRIDLFPRGSGVREKREPLVRAAEALRKARERIGQAGATPESLAQEVRRQIAGEP